MKYSRTPTFRPCRCSVRWYLANASPSRKDPAGPSGAPSLAACLVDVASLRSLQPRRANTSGYKGSTSIADATKHDRRCFYNDPRLHVDVAPEHILRSSLAMLRDVPRSFPRRAFGAHDITMHVLFQHMAIAFEKLMSLTGKQMTRWLDVIYLPTLHVFCDPHSPASAGNLSSCSRQLQGSSRQRLARSRPPTIHRGNSSAINCSRDVSMRCAGQKLHLHTRRQRTDCLSPVSTACPHPSMARHIFKVDKTHGERCTVDLINYF